MGDEQKIREHLRELRKLLNGLEIGQLFDDMSFMKPPELTDIGINFYEEINKYKNEVHKAPRQIGMPEEQKKILNSSSDDEDRALLIIPYFRKKSFN